MDKALLKSTNEFCKSGYPTQAEAMMIIEFDGSEFEVESHIKTAEKIAKENNSSSIKISQSKFPYIQANLKLTSMKTYKLYSQIT